MAATIETIYDYEYYSPEAVGLGGANLDDLHTAAINFSRRLEIDDPMLSCMTGYVGKLISLNNSVDVFDSNRERLFAEAVRNSLPDAVTEEDVDWVDIRTVTDVGTYMGIFENYPRSLLTNAHTDYKAIVGGGAVLSTIADRMRPIIVFDGTGTEVLEGTIKTAEANKIYFPGQDDPDMFDRLLEDLDSNSTLVSPDGTFLRGPVSGTDEPELEGDFTVRNLTVGEWGGLHPGTVHAMPGELSLGRICIALGLASPSS